VVAKVCSVGKSRTDRKAAALDTRAESHHTSRGRTWVAAPHGETTTANADDSRTEEQSALFPGFLQHGTANTSSHQGAHGRIAVE
jgi:hypothetical protein